MQNTNKAHWEKVYATKQPHEVSWTQTVPQLSLDHIAQARLPLDARIIDVGGGDSRLVDCLLQAGYTQITVLDISGKALERARRRLAAAAEGVRWIESDILDFNPDETYDFWHDRAVFHFLTSDQDRRAYRSLVERAAAGFLSIGTFSDTGPLRCSGLDVCRYDEQSLSAWFQDQFETLGCLRSQHQTPFGTVQDFVFCNWKRKSSIPS